MNRALILVSFSMAACEVGEVPSNNGTIDAPIGVVIDAPPIIPIDAAPVALCIQRKSPANLAHVHSAGATTHAGENCLAGGCHLNGNTGSQAPAFQFGGTLYGNDGVTPNAGATLTITAGAVGGATKAILTDNAGNFYLAAGQLQGAFNGPGAKVTASVCMGTGTTGPAPTPMNTPLANTDGACARSGCHTPGAAQGAIKLDPTI